MTETLRYMYKLKRILIIQEINKKRANKSWTEL